jgi:hypothetical protein
VQKSVETPLGEGSSISFRKRLKKHVSVVSLLETTKTQIAGLPFCIFTPWLFSRIVSSFASSVHAFAAIVPRRMPAFSASDNTSKNKSSETGKVDRRIEFILSFELLQSQSPTKSYQSSD